MKIQIIFLTACFAIFSSTSCFAKIKLDIQGISGEEKKNVKVYLEGLDEPRDANDDDYLTEVKKSATSALNVFGFYQPNIAIVVDEIKDKDEQLLTVTIDQGPVTYITHSEIAITGAGKNAPDFVALLATFSLKEGDILLHSNYETAKSSFKSIARRDGYFDAKFDKSLVEVKSKQNSAKVSLIFNTGERYLFGPLVFEQALPADKYVLSLQNFKQGDPFDTRKLSEFNNDLTETGYFKSISLLPDLEHREGLQVPLNVLATMQPEDSFNVGFGYSTDEGIRGKFRWNRPWINQYGHSIEGNLVASIPKQEASLTYKIPLEDPVYNYMSVQTGYKMVNQNDTDTTQYVASLNRHWRLSNHWQPNLFIRYDKEQGIQGQQSFSTSLIIPGVSFSRTRAKGGINTTWGDKIMTSFEVSNEWWLSSDDLIKLYGQTKIIRTYSGHQFVGSMELGAIQTSSIYNVPSSMRFFTGGDQSVRGFDYESIAPEDDQGYLVGGKYLAVASLEYRFPILETWKIAVFSDIGTATDDFSETLSSSAGLGVVWASPVGPIRLYVAKPLTNGVNDFGIHFMLGPEL
ncbi:outer membrane protein assembly factor [Psychromonas sp. psych-6C06]|uniref:autotransporter assembly complex protein TamA n=1 Tax=Psychromonas sp. psych-6C06 TaxID=2058089 RepID=UPI000C3403CD|nr:autotransporter assembly complex family protein [Psychromonas sp. psych-6C06]PKF61050.1 outer membrane protein assembly factor [Psychromonas sp. psych-6C06]